MSMHRRWRPRHSFDPLTWVVAAGLLIGASGAARACPICLAGLVVTIGQQIDSADQVVLAQPESGSFRVVELIKGAAATESLAADTVEGAAVNPQQSAPLLLAYNRLARRWVDLGQIDRSYADWLRQVVAARHHREFTDGDWCRRVAVVLPHVEDKDPVAAQLAFGELARAPYAALRSLREKLDAIVVARWLADPALADRRATYTLLLGVAGQTDDMTRVEQALNTDWQMHDATNLAALITADLEFRGAVRMSWVDTMYFKDRQRTLPELEAILLALAVQGDTDGAVPRARIIESYRLFMQQRPAMAAFVAPKLGDWGYWDAAADYSMLLTSNAIKDEASEFAIDVYLRRAADSKAVRQ
jgi:hypothetical protein